MALDAITSASCVPAAEVLSQITEGMLEVVWAANNVLIKKESFMELAGYLGRVVPVLKILNKKDLGDSEALSNAIQILSREIKAAKLLTVDCTKKNRVYLLMNCRTIMKNLEDTMKEISKALSLLPLASLDISSGIIEDLDKLCDSMMKAELKAAVAEEEILEKVESAIQERNVDRSYANNLVAQIAEAVGISTDRSALKKEFEEFKGEIENVRLRKDEAEAIQMDQIIALLERADVASSPEEKEMRYITKRNSLGTQPFEPLQSFYCPITGEVMEDPVETSSGHTFERSAIVKWLADGSNTCPLTMTPIRLSSIRPNKTLRQSIKEWKDRNTIILIASIKSKLMSEEEEEVLCYLGQLEDLCKQRDQYREWVILENYIPTLIQLLGSKKRDVRILSLSILNILTKDNVDAKERVSNVDNSIESIVRFLGRRIVEGKLAVSLLLELSKCSTARDQIGNAQGCILLLVTMSRNDDKQAAADAQQLLENLSVIDQNIIKMAKANYFRHFLQRIETGPKDVKMLMVSALADMELTDHYKAVLFEGGVLDPLLQFFSNGDIEMKRVAVRALRNLSSLPSNGLQMIREGASGPLLNLLFTQTSSSSSLREEVAATIMHLAISTVNQGSSPTPLSLLQSGDDTIRLFSLISLTGPNVQHNILRTFHALCQSPSASTIKTTLTKYSAMPLLAQLCEHEKPEVRSNAAKLLCCLVEGGDKAIILEHLGQRCLESLLKILRQPSDLEEIASTMGIISNLPEDSQLTRYLFDNEALTLIERHLCSSNQNDPQGKCVVENAAGALRHFTVPTNLEWQKRVTEIGIVPVLVQLLDLGTTLTKKYAAISLARLSQSSDQLTQRIRNRNSFGRFFCFSDPRETTCSIHGGICTIQSSFCLVKADAINPLIRVLEDPDPDTCEASLDALLTLIEGEKLQKGCSLLAETNAIPQMVKLLSSSSLSLQEKTLNALERIFRLPELTKKYGSCAQLSLVDLTQRGNGSMKSLSARILAHLNVLHDQSSYF